MHQRGTLGRLPIVPGQRDVSGQRARFDCNSRCQGRHGTIDRRRNATTNSLSVPSEHKPNAITEASAPTSPPLSHSGPVRVDTSIQAASPARPA